MRYRKGSKVEVLSKKEVPSGAWHCAEIISGNGHTYSVRHDYPSRINGEVVVERVSRKEIRPCPPLESVNGWAAGDLIEFFCVGSWKMAVILKVLGRNYYLVRLVGSLEEFRAHKSNMRVRRSWQNDKWVVIGKVNSKLSCVDTRSNIEDGVALAVQCKTGMEESNSVLFRTLKRASPYCSSHIETHPRKMRAVEKEGERQQVVSASLFPLFEKVDTVAFSRDNLGKKYLNTLLNNETAGLYESEKGDPNGGIICFPGRGKEPIDYDSDICSVGSCSVVNNSPDSKLSGHVLAGSSEDANTLCSDAVSSHSCRDEDENCSSFQNGDERERIHKLEFHAYSSTLAALFVSGPLSWEQETMLTNLRISLHISHDEHSVVLRNLISSGTSLRFS